MHCTEKMYLYAKAISETLDLPEPDYEDYGNISFLKLLKHRIIFKNIKKTKEFLYIEYGEKS